MHGLLTKFGQDGLILAKFLSREFKDRDGVQVHKLAKSEQGQYPAILTEQAWSIKVYKIAFGEILLVGQGG